MMQVLSRFLSRGAVLGTLGALSVMWGLGAQPVLAATQKKSIPRKTAATGQSVAEPEEKSTWKKIRERTRVRYFSETSSPSFRGDGDSMPASDGSELDPINVFNILWADYEFAKNWRALIFTRSQINLSRNSDPASGPSLTVLDPRIGVRRTNVFPNVKNLTTTYDLYVHLGVSQVSLDRGRFLEVGTQMAHSYDVPLKGSLSLTFGLLNDVRYAFFGHWPNNGRGSDFYGNVSPWGAVNINSWLSTQHWFNFPWAHGRNTPWNQFNWAGGGQPFMQNGLGFQMTSWLWGAALVNNYLGVPLTGDRTWASLWLAATIL